MTTVAEMKAQMNALMEQLQALQGGGDDAVELVDERSIPTVDQRLEILNKEIEFFTTEIGKMDRIFSDFTSRFGLLIAIAGLLSFIPAADISYLPYFLKWVFWLFIFAIFTYYPSSLRVQSVIKGITLVHNGHPLEAHYLKERSDYLQFLWKDYLSRYRKVLWWNRATSLLVYAYIISLTVSFYFFVLDKEPNVHLSIDILAGAIVISGIMVWWQHIKSKTNKTVGDLRVDVATGSPPTDLDM